jgi:hypothetical protein
MGADPPIALERALGRPERFTPHDAASWDDPYIGRRILAAGRRGATRPRRGDPRSRPVGG